MVKQILRFHAKHSKFCLECLIFVACARVRVD